MIKPLQARQQQQQPPDQYGEPDTSSGAQGSTGPSAAIIAVIIVVVLLIILTVLYIILRRLRAKGRSAKYLPTNFLKQRWEQWQPISKYKSVSATERGENGTNSSNEYRGREEAAANNAVAAGVDRNTSVRSVMTLPPYSQAPKETEQVLGREGERAGMDTVVEFPETVEEEDAARNTEMESLFQIREARRREIAEREERRRERREAREQGNYQRLEELRREARQRTEAAASGSTGNLTADILIAEHQSRPKERRVSSVAYAAVGQVRHDGTRLRANSSESERGGLLSEAAPMGERAYGQSTSDARSLLTLDNISRPSMSYAGGRQRSDSGALSISTMSSVDVPQPTPPSTDEAAHRTSDSSEQQDSASTSDSRGAARFTLSGLEGESNANAHVDPRIVSLIQDSDNDISRPPEYEQIDWGDAPTYEEALRRRESMRSARLAVPAINVQGPSEPNSPALGRVSEDHARWS